VGLHQDRVSATFTVRPNDLSYQLSIVRDSSGQVAQVELVQSGFIPLFDERIQCQITSFHPTAVEIGKL